MSFDPTPDASTVPDPESSSITHLDDGLREYEPGTPAYEKTSRSRIVIAAVLGVVALLAAGGVALTSGDTWRDNAMSAGVFDAPEGWAGQTSEADGWTSSDAASTPGTSTTATTTRPAPGATVVPATARASKVPTSTAPAPSMPQPSSTVRPTSTATAPAPSPTSTKKPRPTPKPSPTTSPDDGCVLIIIC